jgi:hypothetical protein
MAHLDRLLQNSPQKDTAIAQEIAKRGYDWSSVFASRAGAGSFEMACSQELERVTGFTSGDRAPSGAYAAFRVPFEALYSRDTTDYVVGASNVTGANLVEQEVVSSDPVLPLRPVSAFLGAGAPVIETTKTNVLVPRIYTAPLAGSGETAVTTVGGSIPSGFTSEQVNLQAQYYSSQILVSKQILAQASDRNIRDYIVGLLKTSIAKLLDNLALNGSGAVNSNSQKT